jgi:hypothetical protein
MDLRDLCTLCILLVQMELVKTLEQRGLSPACRPDVQMTFQHLNIHHRLVSPRFYSEISL